MLHRSVLGGLVVSVTVALSVPADALVMCGRKTRDGQLARGASVKLRAACRTSEIEVNPVALGLQGPPGPPGGGAVARDSTDTRSSELRAL